MPRAATPPNMAAGLTAAAVGGVLVALSMPPWGFWPLSFVGVALYCWAAHPLPSRRRAALTGFVFALPWMLIGLAWMWFLTPPGYIVASMLFAALHGAAGALAGSGSAAVIGRPAAHTLAEVIRMLVPFGGVPLATLGIAQSGGPLLGVARVGGVILLTWLVFQVGAAAATLATGWLHTRRATPDADDEPVALAADAAASMRISAGSLVVAIVVVAMAAVAPRGADVPVDPVRIAAVQGGGEQGTSATDVPSSEVTRAHLDATATISVDDDVDVVVWPENGIDVNREPFVRSEVYASIVAEAERLGVPFTVGVTVDSEFSAYPSDGAFVNAQVVVTPAGDVTGSYEKVRIVPFGEYVPLRGALEALGAPLDQVPSDAVRGRDPAVLELPGGGSIGVMISWEVFFGDRGRAAADGEILVNPTNGASYTWTIVQSQQVASSRLRATETGRWVVQVSPTGFSAFVSPDGTVDQRTDVSERAVIIADVPPRSGSTWYTATGDAPWIVFVVLAWVVAWWSCRSSWGWTSGWSRRRLQPADDTSTVTPPAST